MTGLYIHIPFCKKKCPYCSFYSIDNYSIEIFRRYIEALISELETEIYNHTIDTIYIGGGTPSIIPVRDFEYLLLKLVDFICLEDIKEFTIEVNPESVSNEIINLFYSYGVNRISMGVQSFNNDVLHLLGRLHNSQMVYNAIEKIFKYFNINQLSIDLIYDIPLVDSKIIISSVKEAIDLHLTHISAYNYSSENGYLKSFDDFYEEQMPYIMSYFSQNDFEQYEISNFCKKNNISKHNIKYWLMKDYIGIGAGAHSMLQLENKRIRKENISDLYAYIENPTNNKITYNIDLNECIKEDIIFGLRYLRGINIDKYLCIDAFNNISKSLDELIHEGFITKYNNNIKLTQRGILFYDNVAAKLWQS
jgi:oxygen-independent coproporphyrinogen-3 oxidase